MSAMDKLLEGSDRPLSCSPEQPEHEFDGQPARCRCKADHCAVTAPWPSSCLTDESRFDRIAERVHDGVDEVRLAGELERPWSVPEEVIASAVALVGNS